MFNNNSYSWDVNIKPAANGMIQSSHPKAFFKYFHPNSALARELLNDKAKFIDKPVTILQILLVAEGYWVAEIIFNDYITEPTPTP
jgi:hypothetical protein